MLVRNLRKIYNDNNFIVLIDCSSSRSVFNHRSDYQKRVMAQRWELDKYCFIKGLPLNWLPSGIWGGIDCHFKIVTNIPLIMQLWYGIP